MEEPKTRQDSSFVFVFFMCNLATVDAYSTILSSLWYFWVAIFFGVSIFVFVACLLGRAANRNKTRVTTMEPHSGGVPLHVHNQPPPPTSYAQSPPPYTTSQPPPPYTATAPYPPPAANVVAYPPPGTSDPAYPPAYPPPAAYTATAPYPLPGTSDPAYPPSAHSSNVPPPDPFATAVREANAK